VNVGRFGIGLGRLAQVLHGLIQLAIFRLKHAEEMKRIRIALIDRKDQSIELLRLPPVTDPVSRRGTTKQIVGALRQVQFR
jgi:hypothetical protein